MLNLRIFRCVIAVLFLTLFNRCGGDSEPPAPEAVDIVSTQLSDLGNAGNASDLFLEVVLTGDISTLTSLRVYIVEAAQAGIGETIESEFYQELGIASSIRVHLDAATTDIDGNNIAENSTYSAYIQAVASSGTELWDSSERSTLQNESIVDTPFLEGVFDAMEDVVIDARGNIFVAGGSRKSSSIFRVTSDGKSQVHSNGLSQPVGLALDEDDNLYASNFESNVIHKIADGQLSPFISDTRLSGGGGLAIDNSGILYNAFYSTPTVYRVVDGVLEEFVSNAALNGPVGMAYDPQEDQLYVASFNSGQVFAIASDGTLSEIADTPLNIGHLAYHQGSLYATGWNQHQVMEVSLSGEITNTWGTSAQGNSDGSQGQATFTSPNGIDVTPDGTSLYVSQGDGKLRRIILKRN